MQHGMLERASLQKMLYDALDHSDDIVVILEKDGDGAEGIVVAAANDAFCRSSGFSQSDTVGRRLPELLAPDCDPARRSELVQAAHDLRSFRSELLCARSTGTPFWLGMHFMPVLDSAPPCFVILGRDITEALSARQQQAAIQGLLAKVFLCVKAPVAIVSEDGIVQMTNPALDQLLGYPPGGLAGKRALDLNAPNTRPAAIAARQQQVTDGLDYSVVTALLRADGREIPAEITSITVQQKDLRRFRIITVLELAADAPSVTMQPASVEPPINVHVAGKIKLIGLDEIRQALGTRWAEMATRVMASAEHVIRRRCGPHDTFSRTADGGFLICFAETTEDEAALRAAGIAREIRSRLIGEGETGAVAQVSAITTAVELPHDKNRTPDMLSTIIGERLNNRLAAIEQRARETLRDAMHEATCQLEPVRGRRSEPVAQFAKLPADLEGRIQAAYCSLPAAERKQFDFDRLVLGTAAEQAIGEIGAGRSTLIMVNLGFDVFHERHCMERYIAACQALDPRLRDRLILVLSGMPRGIPRSRLLECVMRVRPFCHGVGFQSENMEAPAVDFSNFGSPIVVFLGSDLRVQNPGDMAKLGKLVETLHGYQSRVLVRQVQTWNDAKQLIRLGVDLVSVIQDERPA